MKKISLIFVLACSVMFTSCDLVDTILGSCSVVITDANGGTYYSPNGASSDSIDFSSCVCDIISVNDTSRNFLSVGANIDLTENSVVTFPFIGVLLNDTVPGTIALATLSNDMLYHFSVGNSLTTLPDNLIAIAACDTAFYVSNGGSVVLSTINGTGHLCDASFSNVPMKYVTKSGIDHLSQLMDNAQSGDATAIAELATFSIDTYFPTVTLSGNYSARRMNIMSLVNNLQAGNYSK